MSDFWTSISEKIKLEIKPADLAWDAAMIVLILIAAAVLIRLVSAITASVIKRSKALDTDRSRRVDSLMTLTRSFARYATYFVAIALILSVIGWGKAVTSLIATAGIGGLAIGFGAQNLVRDVVTGLFLMFEHQFAVGDYISIDGAEGTVEAIALRTTYLRGYRGDRHIIPNGSILHVINYSTADYLALVEIGTCYETDTAMAMKVIEQAARRYAASRPDIVIEQPEVPGVVDMGDWQVLIRVVCKVKAMAHYEAERGIRLAVKEEFDRLGIPFPYPRKVMEITRHGAGTEEKSEAANEETGVQATTQPTEAQS